MGRFAVFVSLAIAILIAPLSPAEAQAPYSVRIGTQIWPGALPVYVAIATGSTEKRGINVASIIVSSGGNRRAALLAGEIEFAEFAFSNVPVMAARKLPIKYVMSTHDYETFSMIVRSGLKDQVKELSDLKGRTVGFTTAGAGAWAWARIFLIKAGLNPDTDVRLAGGLSEVNVILTALQSGKIDAYPSWEPITTLAINRGIAYPLVRIWESADHERWIGATGLGSGLTTTQRIIDQQPDLVQRMVDAVKDGLVYINSNPSDRIANLLVTSKRTAEFWSGIDQKTLIDMIEKSRQSFKNTSGAISRSGVAQGMQTAIEGGIVKENFPFEQLVDSSFAGTKP